jgi:M6 family metalloprotease-like protein
MSKASNQYDFASGTGHREYIQEAVNLADSVVDFSTTQSLVILANPDSTGIGSFGPAMIGSPGNGIIADGNEMLNAVTSAYDLNIWGSIWLNHEVTHTLGLVDLYAYKPKSQTEAGLLPYTGDFSYMGNNSFESNAPGLTAWERWLLGWLSDSQILCANPRSDGEINTLITPLSTTGGQKAVVIPVSGTKVVVVESRRASGIDANIAKTGALVYTVDSSIQSGYGPMNVYPRGGADDASFAQSIRAAGESAVASGIKVEVVSSEAAGDTVKITAEDFWIERD